MIFARSKGPSVKDLRGRLSKRLISHGFHGVIFTQNQVIFTRSGVAILPQCYLS
jgi:hypothetical protein